MALCHMQTYCTSPLLRLHRLDSRQKIHLAVTRKFRRAILVDPCAHPHAMPHPVDPKFAGGQLTLQALVHQYCDMIRMFQLTALLAVNDQG